MCSSACFTLLQAGDIRSIKGTKVSMLLHKAFNIIDGKKVFTIYTENSTQALTQFECQRIKTNNCIKFITDLKEKDTEFTDVNEIVKLKFVDFLVK